ncbi:MAG: adenosine kinase [Myxococcota bacterium]|nr:adenosine kinase [Myxococcota bacterium]
MDTDVAGIGNALVDALVRIDNEDVLAELGLTRGQMHPVDHGRWTEVYERLESLGVEIHPGGSCANTIATLALLGTQSILCGQVGEDEFGKNYAQQMTDTCGNNGLRLSPDGNTGKCLSIISTKDAERTLVTDLGAATNLTGVGDFEGWIRNSRLLHVTGYLFLGGPMAKTAWEAMDVAKEAGVPISVDAADPFVINSVKEDMWRALTDYADLAFLNEEEAAALTGKTEAEALVEVANHVHTPVVKLGSRGSLILQENEIIHVGIHAANAIDTTGAGDTYAAGFIHGWLRGWPLTRCADLGARLAALTVSQIGAVCRDRSAIAEALAVSEPA